MTDHVHLPILNNGKPHVSYSEFSTWLKCSWRHKLAYIDKVAPQQPSFALIYGNAQHDYLEHFVTTRDDAQSREIAQKRLSAWRTENDEWFLANIETNKDLQKFDVETLVEKISHIGQKSIEFLDKTFKNWEILRAEDHLYEPAKTLGGKEFSFKGFVDLVIVADAKRGKGKKEIWLLDWKTTSRPWQRQKIQDPIVTYQLVLYKKFWHQKIQDLNVPQVANVDLKEIRCGYITILRESKQDKFYHFIPISVGPTPLKRAEKQLSNFIATMQRSFALKKKSETNCLYCDFKDSVHCPSVLELARAARKNKSPPNLR